MNKIYYKQKPRRIPQRQEYKIIQREASNYEKRLYSNLVKTFTSIFTTISSEYSDTGRYPVRDQINEKINQVLLPFYRQIIKRFSKRLIDDERYRKQEGLTELLVIKYIQEHGAESVTAISLTTRKRLQKIIENGLSEGLNNQEISENIKELSKSNFTRFRSAIIARTETHSALNYAQLETAKNLEIPNLKKQWMSALDDRTREWHRNMNGVKVGMDEKFTVTYKGIPYQMDRPGDPAGGGANVINCRCVLIFVEDEDANT